MRCPWQAQLELQLARGHGHRVAQCGCPGRLASDTFCQNRARPCEMKLGTNGCLGETLSFFAEDPYTQFCSPSSGLEVRWTGFSWSLSSTDKLVRRSHQSSHLDGGWMLPNGGQLLCTPLGNSYLTRPVVNTRSHG